MEFENEDDAYLLGLAQEYSGKTRGGDLAIGRVLESGSQGFSIDSWYRLLREEPVIDSAKSAMLKFLQGSGLVTLKAGNRFGAYTHASMRDNFGSYRMYRPNSEVPDGIEIFSGRLSWNIEGRSAALEIKEIERPNASNPIFELYQHTAAHAYMMRTSTRVWNSLYILSVLKEREDLYGTKYRAMMGVSLAMDTIDPELKEFVPILFPIVIERVEDQSDDAYRSILPGAPEHERLNALLRTAVRGSRDTVSVWERFAMPGTANGGIPERVPEKAR